MAKKTATLGVTVRSVLVLVVLQLALALGSATTVTAFHSMPSQPRYWDCNNDGVADDGCANGYKAGSGWGGDANDRFADAFNEWSTETDFDPDDTTSGQPVYKDDRYVSCLGGNGYWDGSPNVLAVVCGVATWRLDSYWDIGSTKTYINYLHNWDYDANPTLPPAPGVVSFEGVLVHELGHWVFLKDLNCNPGVTMCNQMNESGTYNAASLHSDEIASANSVYQ